jgi:hypothetical protein
VLEGMRGRVTVDRQPSALCKFLFVEFHKTYRHIREQLLRRPLGGRALETIVNKRKTEDLRLSGRERAEHGRWRAERGSQLGNFVGNAGK